MQDFLNNNPALVKIYLLIDSRRGISDEEDEFLSYLRTLNKDIFIIFTKVDKLNNSEKAYLEKEKIEVSKLNISYFDSAMNNNNLIEKIRKDIIYSLK